ncbi:hypothetical protein HAX54_006768 [Datura stramonium]|uniref:Uncharacterized protein n=1 Tax=Datura stramonium TaxID=4076 RepID=A0ABS8TBJ4_DATST|nr:hypothetical protein [Datura stramonium]
MIFLPYDDVTCKSPAFLVPIRRTPLRPPAEVVSLGLTTCLGDYHSAKAIRSMIHLPLSPISSAFVRHFTAPIRWNAGPSVMLSPLL